MSTVLTIAGAVVCFLLAISCLFSRAPAAPEPGKPDAADRWVFWLLLRREPKVSQSPDAKQARDRENLARVVGFLLFAGWGVWLILR